MHTRTMLEWTQHIIDTMKFLNLVPEMCFRAIFTDYPDNHGSPTIVFYSTEVITTEEEFRSGALAVIMLKTGVTEENKAADRVHIESPFACYAYVIEKDHTGAEAGDIWREYVNSFPRVDISGMPPIDPDPDTERWN